MTAAAPHVYVDSDVPARMKLSDWRRTHTTTRPPTRRPFVRRIRRTGASRRV
jgi:hypothetical protein